MKTLSTIIFVFFAIASVVAQDFEFPEHLLESKFMSENTKIRDIESIQAITYTRDYVGFRYKLKTEILVNGSAYQVITQGAGLEIHSGRFIPWTSQRCYTYIGRTNRISRVSSCGDKTQSWEENFTYDSKGRVSEVHLFVDSKIFDKTQYLYRDGGSEVTVLLTDNSDDGLGKDKTIWKRKSGRWVRKTALDDKGAVREIVTFDYDAKGFLIKRSVDSDERFIYEYKVDKKGNWIERLETEYDKNKKGEWTRRGTQKAMRIISYND